MKTEYLKTTIQSAVLVTALACGISLRAAAPSAPQTPAGGVASQSQFQTVDFSEARSLTRAYWILAGGDHDYKGHRVKAMHQIEAAAKLLGVDLHGKGVGHKPQALSDDRLREARGMLQTVLGASEVRDQPRIRKHISAAINQINDALAVR